MADVYFEFVVQGPYVKVSAIDEDTGVEVSLVGAAGTSRPDLKRLALRKLDRALRKDAAPLPDPQAPV